jgi:GNAT superfamily N-acetyltransferase
VEIRRIDAASQDALALVKAMVENIEGIYGPAMRPTPSATVDDFSPPTGGFVAIYDDGRAVAGGGVKRLADGIGEIKRMYVVPEMRGRGLARRLLGALEQLGRDLGYARMRLDTGAEQPHAHALYLSAGYSEVPDYNDNPYATFWGEKAL